MLVKLDDATPSAPAISASRSVVACARVVCTVAGCAMIGSSSTNAAAGVSSPINIARPYYCNVEMIDTDDKTIRLEQCKPGQLPAPVTEENREPPVSRDRKDTFSYNHSAHIKTF